MRTFTVLTALGTVAGCLGGADESGDTGEDDVPSCTSVTLTSPTSGANGNVGSPISLAASAVCPVGVIPELQFWVKPSTTSAWTVLPGYTIGSSSWTPPSSGTWNVLAAARAQGADVAYQVLSVSSSVVIASTNRAPLAVNDAIVTPANAAGSVDVSDGDSDSDGDTFSVTSYTQPANGAAVFTGSQATYTPATDFVGADAFTYTITDARGATATATVNVTVTNLIPTTSDDLIDTQANATGSVDVLLNDSDGNHDALAVTSYTQGAYGAVSVTGSVASYVPAASYVGADAFTYTITDARGATSTATVNVIVRPITPGCTLSIANTTASPTYGENLHLVATASCTTGPAEVQWYHKENSAWRIVQPYSASTTLDITAAIAGNDHYYAVARTQGTTSPVATSNTVTVVVADNVPSCTSVKMTEPVTSTSATVNVPMTLAALATCPVGVTPEFQFWVKPTTSSSWTILPGYTETTGSWTPPSTGTWHIKAAARAVGAHVAYHVLSSASLVTIEP
jgi:hypothetical protein